MPSSFWLCHLKLKRPIKSPTLKDNPFYQLTSKFTITNTTWCKLRRKLQIYWNKKLALMAFLPTLCVCENVEWTKRNVVKHGTHPNHQLAAFVTDPVMEIKRILH